MSRLVLRWGEYPHVYYRVYASRANVAVPLSKLNANLLCCRRAANDTMAAHIAVIKGLKPNDWQEEMWSLGRAALVG